MFQLVNRVVVKRVKSVVSRIVGLLKGLVVKPLKLLKKCLPQKKVAESPKRKDSVSQKVSRGGSKRQGVKPRKPRSDKGKVRKKYAVSSK